MERMTTWTPRRSRALVVSLVVLAAAAVLITGGLDAFDLGLLPDIWVASLGLTVAVLGADGLNLAFWYPLLRPPGDAHPPAPSLLSEGERFMVRVLVRVQFYAWGGVLAVQVAAGALAILGAGPGQVAYPAESLGGVGGMLSALPALLGAIFNYVLSYLARRMAWPPRGEPEGQTEAGGGARDARDRPRERAAWYDALGTGRATHQPVIGAAVLSVLPALSVRFGQVAVHLAVGALTLVVVSVLLYWTALEVRHLVRVRRGA